jgi:chemotaxis protein MotC
MIRVFLICFALFISASGSVVADEAGTGANSQPAEDVKPPIDIKPKLEAKPEAAVKSPFEIVRSLDALQDQIVQGNTAAQHALPRVISQIGDRLLAADPQSWRQAKNARAVLTYTLSGGQARVVRKVLQIGNSPELEKRLMEGALAYIEGQEIKASQLLLPIDAKLLPPTVGGHVALVQAMLMGREDLNRSNEFLDVARILVPGTLVEETALRREIFNLSDSGDLNKFVLLSSQYLRRFQKSPYAENFKQKFYTTVIHLGMTDNPEQFNKVVKAASELETEDQLHLYMLIAQAAILNGNAAVAHLAAEKAMAVAKAGSPDSVRAQLFEAAALILTSNYDQGLAKLKELEGSQMSKQDGELKSAILSMAKQIRQWPELPDTDDDVEPKANPKAPGRDGTLAAAAGPVIDLAQKAISDTDQLLQEHAR